MRLDNLAKAEKEKAKFEPHFLLQVLEEEYDALKEELVSRPLDQLQELRGKAKVVASLIKLLS